MSSVESSVGSVAFFLHSEDSSADGGDKSRRYSGNEGQRRAASVCGAH